MKVFVFQPQVRMAAFEVLGSFIATFADPSVTGLYLTDDGVLDFRPTNGLSEMYVSPRFLSVSNGNVIPFGFHCL
jgi:hypothetical protein